MVKLEENVHLLHVVSWGWRYIWCLFKHTTNGNGAFHYVTGHFNFQESVEERD